MLRNAQGRTHYGVFPLLVTQPVERAMCTQPKGCCKGLFLQ